MSKAKLESCLHWISLESWFDQYYTSSLHEGHLDTGSFGTNSKNSYILWTTFKQIWFHPYLPQFTRFVTIQIVWCNLLGNMNLTGKDEGIIRTDEIVQSVQSKWRASLGSRGYLLYTAGWVAFKESKRRAWIRAAYGKNSNVNLCTLAINTIVLTGKLSLVRAPCRLVLTNFLTRFFLCSPSCLTVVWPSGNVSRSRAPRQADIKVAILYEIFKNSISYEFVNLLLSRNSVFCFDAEKIKTTYAHKQFQCH
jgi:hypothetical protein